MSAADGVSLYSASSATATATISEQCQECRSSLWTHVPHQFGSLTSAALGKAARFIVDPILDRQKKTVLAPVLARARSLKTTQEWREEVDMRLSSRSWSSTAKILEAMRYTNP